MKNRQVQIMVAGRRVLCCYLGLGSELPSGGSKEEKPRRKRVSLRTGTELADHLCRFPRAVSLSLGSVSHLEGRIRRWEGGEGERSSPFTLRGMEGGDRPHVNF